MTKLERTLNKIAKDFDCEVEIGNEFAYYYEESKIVVDPTDTDETFLALARENGLNEEVSSFVISFFHELGHNETLDYVDEYEGDKNALSMKEYFYLEEEFEATDWAIDFCNNNMDIVKEIEKNL